MKRRDRSQRAMTFFAFEVVARRSEEEREEVALEKRIIEVSQINGARDSFGERVQRYLADFPLSRANVSRTWAKGAPMPRVQVSTRNRQPRAAITFVVAAQE